VKVRTKDNPKLGRFELYSEDELVGFATYSVSDGVMSMPHTEVRPRLRGRGLASTLVRNALEIARERGLEVLPFCPFVARYIADHPDYVSLVPADQRARFGLDTAAHGRSSPT
jgi:predicted GNAT family acetyltransferase